eukprot:TRINITY_DN7688_c0_g1_i1.p1 TRINITY_DN7688_c0_g1~~TRINITY_DN7688_c0_g1_i1.p1  ORF type:complete len:794 (+),score=128.02 TRINITY_DN7688_c0_g1_i1:351-2384(+)
MATPSMPPPLRGGVGGVSSAARVPSRSGNAQSPAPIVAARRQVAAVTGCGSASPGVMTPRAFPARTHTNTEFVLQSPRRLTPNICHEPSSTPSSGVSTAVGSPRRPGFGNNSITSSALGRRIRLATPVIAPPNAAQQTSPDPLLNSRSGRWTPAPPALSVPKREEPAVGPETLAPGIALAVGHLKLKCADMLGSGSYSTVWLANVEGPRTGDAPVVALKDVFCRGKAALQQSLFEVQLLMAVERRAMRASMATADTRFEVHVPRLPRCLAYQVDPVESGGWNVRMALTRLKGEQLDGWLQKMASAAVAAEPQTSWPAHLRTGCTLARRLLQQLGPTLDSLAPLAWHRDVNSHNVLVCNDGSEDQELTFSDAEQASFWLCDLGLAVDSQSWISEEEAAWRVTDIGGDCRYWPASCWMVHCYGAEYLEAKQSFCKQYKTRLDIHALGITAIEVVCFAALAARKAGAPCNEGEDLGGCWSWLLETYQRYHETVTTWWQAIYAVFSSGGDFRPVHAWLVEIEAPAKVISLVSDLRLALCTCATACSDQATSRLLRAVAELSDEASTLELHEICKLVSGAPTRRGILDGGNSGVPSPEVKPRVAQEDTVATMNGHGNQEASKDSGATTTATTAAAAAVSTAGTTCLSGSCEAERARCCEELEKLQKHRSRVLLAQSLIGQMP